MKSIFVDCALGISGDMLASALFDLGVPKYVLSLSGYGQMGRTDWRDGRTVQVSERIGEGAYGAVFHARAKLALSIVVGALAPEEEGKLRVAALPLAQGRLHVHVGARLRDVRGQLLDARAQVAVARRRHDDRVCASAPRRQGC